jgi:hypothetical protein
MFFAGTNLLYTSDKLYIIKENSNQYWTENAAKKDATDFGYNVQAHLSAKTAHLFAKTARI